MKVLLAAAVLTVLLCSVCCDPFTVKISTKREFKFGEEIECEVIIANSNDRDSYLLARNTPLEGLRSHIFSVSTSGKVLPYDGMLLKRGSPSKAEYIFVRAKSSVSASVDLSRVYSFASTGAYNVQLKTKLQYFEDNPANVSIQQVSSNIEVFTLVESEQELKLTKGALARQNKTQALASPLRAEAAISPSFGGSRSSSDETTAKAAYTAAYNVLYSCYLSVTGNPSLYKTWFGLAYSGNTETVQVNYLTIKSAMEIYQYTLYFHGPECEHGDYAYTFYASTRVYLCDSYFKAPTTGRDSKMGTLVHEMSHAAADTDDIEYGSRSCQKLAADDPFSAIENADNYEYFAEAQ